LAVGLLAPIRLLARPPTAINSLTITTGLSRFAFTATCRVQAPSRFKRGLSMPNIEARRRERTGRLSLSKPSCAQ